MKHALVLASVIVIGLSGKVTVVSAENGPVSAAPDVMIVDFKGRPPFKRRIERLDEVNLARLEVQAEVQAEGRRVFRSWRPPFKRRVERLDEVDLARLEVQDEGRRVYRSWRPPFRRHSR